MSWLGFAPMKVCAVIALFSYCLMCAICFNMFLLNVSGIRPTSEYVVPDNR